MIKLHTIFECLHQNLHWLLHCIKYKLTSTFFTTCFHLSSVQAVFGTHCIHQLFETSSTLNPHFINNAKEMSLSFKTYANGGHPSRSNFWASDLTRHPPSPFRRCSGWTCSMPMEPTSCMTNQPTA